ncbi:histidine phosphatase family protein [Candidatus Woesearchaeota archaeon]|nr:histidine phosphatase family protein [Candidatus Woesearchaeota archaeon]
MKLILVRHGETVENATGICQGQSYGTLSEKGKEQARKVGLRLKSEKIDTAYVSDLERTKDTAKEILKYHPHVPVIYTKDLRERSWGVFEGRPREERRLYSQDNKISLHDMHPENGESYHDVLQRMLRFYTSLLRAYPIRLTSM